MSAAPAYTIGLASVLALMLVGCAALETTGRIIEALPEPYTPAERCVRNDGRWVNDYDARGDIAGGKCVAK